MLDSAIDSQMARPTDPGYLRLPERIMVWAAWGLSVGLFATVGWMALQPYDPLGAVSIFTADRPGLMLVEVLAISALVSVLATALAGRHLPDAGVYAVALGLAVANLRGATSGQLLIDLAGADAAARDGLAWKLAGEGCVWFLAIVVAMIAGGIVMRWMVAEQMDDASVSLDETALAEASTVLPLIDPAEVPAQRRVWIEGLTITGVTLVGSMLVFRLLVTGSPLRSVQHGQTYFALFAAFYISGLVAYRFWRTKTVLWGCLAPPLLCLVGYVFSALGSDPAEPYSQLASVPPSSFFRALPIEYVSVGTLGAISAFWSARRHWLSQSADLAPRQKTSSKRR